MGTRADFYVGNGKEAEWLGSIAWDGYPQNDDLAEILGAQTELDYRQLVKSVLGARDDATFPENGWPWPWEDSGTTDFSYHFVENKIRVCCFGRGMIPVAEALGGNIEYDKLEEWAFPDMTERKKVAPPGSKRSGLITVSGRPPESS